MRSGRSGSGRISAMKTGCGPRGGPARPRPRLSIPRFICNVAPGQLAKRGYPVAETKPFCARSKARPPAGPAGLADATGRPLPARNIARSARAGSFPRPCYDPDLATEVTLQPIRRFGFAAILFADIPLVPQARGRARLPRGRGAAALDRHGPGRPSPGSARPRAIHETLAPVYETVQRVRAGLPAETALIGFAGRPGPSRPYMIAGRGTPDQAPARRCSTATRRPSRR